MRYTILGLIAVVIAASAPAQAEQISTAEAPSWNDCYRLAWVRGVHTEQNELPAFTEQCLAGNIPFDEGFLFSHEYRFGEDHTLSNRQPRKQQ